VPRARDRRQVHLGPYAAALQDMAQIGKQPVADID
jgi:hypothetical protein